PSNEIPEIDVPFIDKWTHLVLFGVFTFLWLCATPVINLRALSALALISIVFGSFIEFVQGTLTFPARSMAFMDAVADGVGGMLGIGLFCLSAWFVKRHTQ